MQRTTDGTVELLQKAIYILNSTYSLQSDLLSPIFGLTVHLVWIACDI